MATVSRFRPGSSSEHAGSGTSFGTRPERMRLPLSMFEVACTDVRSPLQTRGVDCLTCASLWFPESRKHRQGGRSPTMFRAGEPESLVHSCAPRDFHCGDSSSMMVPAINAKGLPSECRSCLWPSSLTRYVALSGCHKARKSWFVPVRTASRQDPPSICCLGLCTLPHRSRQVGGDRSLRESRHAHQPANLAQGVYARRVGAK